jgi:hypothetical protein
VFKRKLRRTNERKDGRKDEERKEGRKEGRTEGSVTISLRNFVGEGIIRQQKLHLKNTVTNSNT